MAAGRPEATVPSDLLSLGHVRGFRAHRLDGQWYRRPLLQRFFRLRILQVQCGTHQDHQSSTAYHLCERIDRDCSSPAR